MLRMMTGQKELWEYLGNIVFLEFRVVILELSLELIND